MAWAPDEDTNQLIWHLALQNAFEYEGKGAVGSVIGRIMSTALTFANLEVKSVQSQLQSVQKANALAQEKGLEHIEAILMAEAPQLLEGRQKQEKRRVA